MCHNCWVEQGFDEAHAEKPCCLLLHADRHTAALNCSKRASFPYPFIVSSPVWADFESLSGFLALCWVCVEPIQQSRYLPRLSSMMMRCLCSKYGAKRFGGLVRTEINSEAAGPLNELSDDTAITRTQFEDLLAKIDKGLRALPATAQVRHCSQPSFVTSRFIIRIMLTNIVIVSI